MEVPRRVADAASFRLLAERIPPPGANKSKQVPKLEKSDLSSFLSVDPTVMAVGSDAGLSRQASMLSFPAATTTTTPVATSAATASFTG